MQNAVQTGQKTNDALKYCNALIALGDCYMRQNKNGDARKCLQKALTISEKHALKILEPEILVKLAKCCEEEDPVTYEKYKNRFFKLTANYLKKARENCNPFPFLFLERRDPDETPFRRRTARCLIVLFQSNLNLKEGSLTQ